MNYAFIDDEMIPLGPALVKVVQNVSAKVLEQEGVEMDTSMYITITDNEDIHEINLEHRNVDAPTDVLSFPLLSYETPGKIEAEEGDFEDGRLVLGDIVISDERARQQAEEYGHSVEREYGFLVAHSTLHLLGYDHEEESERTVMREKEEKALASLGLTR